MWMSSKMDGYEDYAGVKHVRNLLVGMSQLSVTPVCDHAMDPCIHMSTARDAAAPKVPCLHLGLG